MKLVICAKFQVNRMNCIKASCNYFFFEASKVNNIIALQTKLKIALYTKFKITLQTKLKITLQTKFKTALQTKFN